MIAHQPGTCLSRRRPRTPPTRQGSTQRPPTGTPRSPPSGFTSPGGRAADDAQAAAAALEGLELPSGKHGLLRLAPRAGSLVSPAWNYPRLRAGLRVTSNRPSALGAAMPVSLTPAQSRAVAIVAQHLALLEKQWGRGVQPEAVYGLASLLRGLLVHGSLARAWGLVWPSGQRPKMWIVAPDLTSLFTREQWPTVYHAQSAGFARPADASRPGGCTCGCPWR
jgi:hypothetical protein